MSTKQRRRPDDELFWKRHKPKRNHLLPEGAPYGDAMYETYGEEEAYVKQQDQHSVFTLLECDGRFYGAPGFHHVNRFGYFIVEVPWTKEQEQRIYKL